SAVDKSATYRTAMYTREDSCVNTQHPARKPLPSSMRAVALGLASLTAALCAPAIAQQVTMETLLDRIQVEDFLTRYYYDLSQGNAHELSDYFTEDALLDVDGTVAVGHAEIDALYGGGPRNDG